MKTRTILSVFGTRPEAIKMLPLVKQIQQTPGLQSIVCITAQHREMLDQVMKVFQVTADYDLNIMKPGQTLTSVTAAVLTGMEPVLKEVQPDLVLVHGDTNTSFSTALAAFYQQIPVGHVEAGLRTFDRYSPFPEEVSRNLITKLSTLHFAPTALNVANLAQEGVTEQVYQTGNTVIDALFSFVGGDYSYKSDELRALELTGKRIIAMTAHRRENLGQPMRNIFNAVVDIVNAFPDVAVVYPIHKNPAVREPAREILGGHERIHLIEPIDVDDLYNLMKQSTLVMTDSGGIQEEAPSLGKPVLVLRTETERPEAVTAGVVKLVGVERNDIVREATTLLTDKAAYDAMSRAMNPYGDGHASERICKAIVDYFNITP